MSQNKDLNYEYIREAIDNKSDAIIFLINGISLKGQILDQDDLCIVMTCTSANSKSKKQLVFKDAMSTVST